MRLPIDTASVKFAVPGLADLVLKYEDVACTIISDVDPLIVSSQKAHDGSQVTSKGGVLAFGVASTIDNGRCG